MHFQHKFDLNFRSLYGKFEKAFTKASQTWREFGFEYMFVLKVIVIISFQPNSIKSQYGQVQYQNCRTKSQFSEKGKKIA